MNDHQQKTARACFEGAEKGTMSFPEIVGALIEAGFEGYLADLRRGGITYYVPSGESTEVVGEPPPVSATPHFDAAAVRAAIAEAQHSVPGYTYKGFCETVARAGCVAYLVSFAGRRVIYLGRTAEAHTELFPPAP